MQRPSPMAGSPPAVDGPRPERLRPAGAADAGARVGPLGVALLAAAVVACRLLALRAVPIYDDAFITYRYAQNLARGAGLVFNPGAAWEPVLGTTTPGYGVVLAGLVALGLEVRQASLGLNLLADATSLWLLARLFDRRAVPTVIAGLGLAALPQLARISMGGMESPLLLCATLAAALAARARGPGKSAAGARPVVAGLLAAACVSLRPESVLLVLVLGLAHLRPPARLVRYAAPVLAFGAAYTALLWWVYGSPVPQSVVAKSGLPDPVDWTVRARIILTESFAPLLPMVAALPLVAWGAVRLLARRVGPWPLVAFALAMVAAYLLKRPKTWGWYFYLPLASWVVCVAAGTEALLERLGLAARAQRALARPLVVGGLAALVVAAGAVAIGRRPDAVTPNVYEAMAAWAEEDRPAERGASVYASDIGAIAFFSGARVLDAEGLVWPAALAYEDKLGAVREHRPEYVLLVANHARLGAFLADPELTAAYALHRRFDARGRTELAFDAETLPRGWVQDYALYRLRESSR